MAHARCPSGWRDPGDPERSRPHRRGFAPGSDDSDREEFGENSLQGVEIRDAEVIHSLENPHSKHGGLAILFGNLAPKGSVVKTGGVAESMRKFSGPAHIYESHDEAMAGILAGEVRSGEVIVIRYEGPKGGPGMMEMLSPTSALMGMGLGEQVALITDGRFSGGRAAPVLGTSLPKRRLAAQSRL